jgi:membrane protein YqaA with SNARE-associated domain
MSDVSVAVARPAARVFAPWEALQAAPDRVRIGLALLLMLGLSALVLVAPVDYRSLGNVGYLGVFVVTLLATAALVLPVPYIGIVMIAGSFLDPILVAVVAGLAAALGELTGYVLGATGRSLLPEHRWIPRLEGGMRRFGAPVIFLAALVPNPAFDAVGLIAGTTRLPLWMFLIPCFLGKTIRLWVLASLGGLLPG